MLRKFRIGINGKEYIVEMEELTAAPTTACAAAPAVAPVAAPSTVLAAAPAAVPIAQAQVTAASVEGGTVIEAPMPGTILEVKVKVGDKVELDQCLAILEAMKMENEIVAPKAGTIAAVHILNGTAIDVGGAIITIN